MNDQATQEITIRNDFHHTETTVRVPCATRRLTRRQVQRVRRTLCGIADCRCGGVLGERGPQEQRWVAVPVEGGGVQLETEVE